MKNTYQSHMHKTYKDIIFLTCCMYLVEHCQILWPLWAVFHNLMIENHVHTTSTCKKKLLHWKNSIYIPSTHAYPFWCSICHKVSSQNSLVKAWAMYWKKRGHMKAHEKKWTHEGPCKNCPKYKKGEIKSWNILPSCFLLHPPHIHTHALLDHGCMTCLLFGSDLWLCKILGTSMPWFFSLPWAPQTAF